MRKRKVNEKTEYYVTLHAYVIGIRGPMHLAENQDLRIMGSIPNNSLSWIGITWIYTMVCLTLFLEYALRLDVI